MTTKRKPEIIKPGAYYGYTEAQKRANKRYMENMVKINLTVSPERRETIKKHASVMNESMSAFINRAIDETIAQDKNNIN